jgi:hypothetical protein
LQSTSNYLFCFIRPGTFKFACSRSPPRQRHKLSRSALIPALTRDVGTPASIMSVLQLSGTRSLGHGPLRLIQTVKIVLEDYRAAYWPSPWEDALDRKTNLPQCRICSFYARCASFVTAGLHPTVLGHWRRYMWIAQGVTALAGSHARFTTCVSSDSSIKY